jgi:4-amino-4-deoxy-L-arabinose transferase-like glycosyltransferase
MGDWFMLSHQSITDMPFVASLTAAMSLLIIGLTTDDDKTVRATPIKFGKKIWNVSAYHLALGIVLVCALPQALYLLSRNFTLVTKEQFGFDVHMDEYRSGQGHECWIAPGAGDAFERLMRIGKWPCELAHHGKWLTAHPEMQPAVQGVLWLGCLFALLYINRNERRISRLCFIVAYVFASISTMGKGIAGLALPICVVGCYILTARKWRDVLRLELVSGLLVVATVAAPWYAAMYFRMGDEFIQQLFVHHMWKRALDHVHDTNQGDDVSLRYYVWQLGYAMFPWTGLVPAGLVWWVRTRWGQAQRAFSVAEQRVRDVGIFLVMWFVFAWALFTYMKTKFHHYIFPAVPPAALLTGIFIDDVLGKKKLAPKNVGVWIAATIVGSVLVAYGLSRLVPGNLSGHLDLPDFDKMSSVDIAKFVQSKLYARPILGSILALVGLVVGVFVAKLFMDEADAKDAGRIDVSIDDEEKESSDGISARAAVIGGLLLSAAIGVALVVRDLASRPESDIKGQERLIQLYTYRYDRVWPKELWFQPALLGFGLAVVVLTLVLTAKAWRRQAMIALFTVSALYAAWTLDDYMMYVAPHWGQRPLFEAYYKDRHNDHEPIVAFEMNWKGENFYSGGRLIEFGNGMSQGSTSGERGSDRMRTWLTDMRQKTGAVYFVTEAGRISKIEEMLKGILGAAPNGGQWAQRITTDQMDNKFVVVRARWGG